MLHQAHQLQIEQHRDRFRNPGDRESPGLQRTLTLDPANGRALFYLGKVQFDLGRMPESEVALKRALEQPLAPKWLRSAHYYPATVCRRLGKSGEAASPLAVFKQLEAEAASTGKESK